VRVERLDDLVDVRRGELANFRQVGLVLGSELDECQPAPAAGVIKPRPPQPCRFRHHATVYQSGAARSTTPRRLV
jgi:hypothetical protein